MKHNTSLLAGLAMLIALTIFSIPAAATRYYVTENGDGSNNGVNWSNAYNDLQLAINNASAGDSIFVAAGTYYPMRKANSLSTLSLGNRDNAFVLKKDVKIYGGFAGNDDNETNIDQRDWKTNQTILSGNINQTGSNRAYHVVISVGCTNATLLDGLTISGGNADGDYYLSVDQIIHENYGGGMYNVSSSPTLTNVTISGDTANGNGGGMYNENSLPTLTNVTISENTSKFGGGMYNSSSSPMLTNVTISGNQSTTNGGGMYNSSSSSPMLTNVTISGNSAKSGGGMYNETSSPKLTNVTISGNQSTTNGGGMYNTSSSSKPSIKNSIIWGNNSGVYNNNSAVPEYTYSLVQDLNPIGTGNLDGTNAANNPQFVNPLSPGLSTGGDYHLHWSSPAINAGSKIFNATNQDLDGRPRFDSDSIDLGAYEFVETIFPNDGVIYVDSSKSTGTHTGNNWSNAVDTLDQALFYTKRQHYVHPAATYSIFVAKGTYYPSVIAGTGTNTRDKAFVLVKDVKIYGGFAGTEATIDQRTPGNTTILSGNNDAYHVVISADSVGAALLDGLTISGGNANGTGSIKVNNKTANNSGGGGMYNASSSPTLINVTISGNIATYGGGMHNYNSSPMLTNVTISGNSATYYGGMYNGSSSPTLTNVTISGNSATATGGGMYNNDNSSPMLTNVTISGNKATDGGGMYNNYYSNPQLTNVTISGNTATNAGGGMYNSSSNPRIKNSIIWGNNSGVHNSNSAVPEYKYSLVQGKHLTDNGNLDSTINPQFVDSAGGDYRLKWRSPAIDAGNNADNATTQDLAGNQRRLGTIDMGAYEYTLLPTNGIIYVDSAVVGGKHDGSSWANAVDTLDEALFFTKWKTSTGGAADSIFVAKGTYYPSVIAGQKPSVAPATAPGDQAFVLVKDVKIYGGFAGNDTTIDQRTPGNTTILSGNNDAYHVVISADSVGTALLDGLTISGGNSDGSGDITVNGKSIFRDAGGGMYNVSSSPTLTNVTISGNSASFGGGMHNGDSSSPTLTNVTISGNTADVGAGGGMYNDASSPVLTNVTISGNTASAGGGMHNISSSSPELTNVTISGNMADAFGGGMYNVFSSSPKLTNVTISGNTATDGGGMYNVFSSSPKLTNVTISGNSADLGGGMYNNSSSTPTIQNSIIWGNNSGVDNESSVPEYKYSLVQGEHSLEDGNIDGAINPQFVDAAGGDYHLHWSSPAINAGSKIFNATTNDLDGRPRFDSDSIDLGAYEFVETISPDDSGILYVDSSKSTGTHTGYNWSNAVDTLDQALFYTKRQHYVHPAATYSIFVAKGTYYPSIIAGTGTNTRDQAFVLVRNVKIYGGFAGNEATIDQRTSGNTTILSGNNDAYHVVISADSVGAALLDGLTISGGNANGSDSIAVNNKLVNASFGGGIYNVSASPELTNVIISGNKGTNGAGIYNDSSSSALTNVIINANVATGNGGGIYNNTSSPTLTNVTISSDTATNGGGVYNSSSSSTPTIQNSIIWGNNTGVSNNGASPVYTYSLVQGEHLTDNGNLDSTINPQFVDSAAGDYRLKWSSPAIDAGDSSLNATTKDLAGNPRLSHNLIDLGAYENQDNYYIVVLPDEEITGISSINITADENNYLQFLPGKYRVLSGNTFTFTLTYADGYDEKPANVANNGVKLFPNDAGTYTISDEAVVTITGVANGDTEEDNGDGDGNDGSGGNGELGLIITDGTTTIIERIYIDSIEVPFDTTKAVNYILACGQSGKLRFSLITEASGPGLLEFPLNLSFDFTPKPGLNHIPVNIFAIDGTVSHQYDFVIEKQFEYDSLIAQKWNNTLLVRSNPNNNGGYTFVKYKWFCNNTLIGTEGFYSAGDLRTDLLDFDALYYAEMHTKDGQTLQTCPGKPVRTAVAASLRVYPNPVRSGNIAHIQSGSNSEQLLNVAEPTEVSIYDSMGKFVKMQKLTAPLTEFVLDVTPGIYFIRLGEQQVKVFVD